MKKNIFVGLKENKKYLSCGINSEIWFWEIENKNKMLSKVIGLIGELQNSLDMDKGGELSENLYGLYGYMISQVTKANIKNDPEPLSEVAGLIAEIKSGWDAIPLEIRQQYSNR